MTNGQETCEHGRFKLEVGCEVSGMENREEGSWRGLDMCLEWEMNG